MKTFVVINENLIFKEATKLFEFFVPKDDNRYILYYVTDLEDNKSNLMVSYLMKNEMDGYFYIKDLDDKQFDKISTYIDFLLLGNSSRKEIKIVDASSKFEPNLCQVVTEKDRYIDCDNISDIEYAIDRLDSKYFNNYIYINDLNEALYDVIVSRNNMVNFEREKENIKGNVNIFLLTLFSVVFLIVLIIMGFDLFYYG